MNDLRQRLFDRGADAVEIVAPSLGRAYACPQCLKPFRQEDLDSGTLTLEDVPPKALGGKPLMLTCKTCNNAAGTRLDAEWRKRQNLLDFMAGTLDKPIKGQVFKAGGFELPVSVKRVGGQIELWGAPQATHPDNAEGIGRHMDDLVAIGEDADGYEFQISGFSHRPREANLSILRMAYLVCFAIWGYTFVTEASLALVRRQLNNIEDEVLHDSTVALFNPNTADDLKTVVRVIEPVDAVLVINGKHSALVPVPGSDPNPYVLQNASAAGDLGFAGARGWPTSLELLLDLAPGI